MKRYDQILFLCTANTLLSPLAEGIYRKNSLEWMPEPMSRGLVVLFEEPIHPKCNILLSQNGFPISSHGQARQLEAEDLKENSLVLTMTLSEKVKLCEEYQYEDNVYTLGEYVGEDTDIVEPARGEEEEYKECFEKLKHRVDKVIQKIEEEYWAEEEQEEK
ncbi:MAG: hypothetical protein LUH14_07735 [Clostridiaceae bacterium]|nr:hypothetical protein [Clostridiaceae bacterium]